MVRYDVIVLGGGTAGTVAAIQAGRLGARTLLVEKTGRLGGTITTAGVNAIQSFFAYGQQVIAGIGWQWACRTFEDRGEPVPDGSQFRGSGVTNVVVDAFTFSAIADEMICEAGVDLRLHTMLAGLNEQSDGWQVTLCGKEGLQNMTSKVVIDCTGDADAVRLAGLAVDKPEEVQPGTLVFQAGGYAPGTLDTDAIQAAFDEAVAAGEVQPSDTGWFHGKIGPLLQGGSTNVVHVTGIDGSTTAGRTHAEVQARKVVLRLQRFFRRQKGLENYHVAWQAAEVGIRESVVIQGRSRVLGEDYQAGRIYDDAIGYAFYPIDVHTAEGLDFQPLPQGTVPTIPFGALVPSHGRNILAAGRTVSSDRRANSALRVQAPCMVMGQATGAAGALAADRGCDVNDVPIPDLRHALSEHGAILPAE